MLFKHTQKYMLLIFAWFSFTESEGILHMHSFTVSHGGPLVFEYEMCPRLQYYPIYDELDQSVILQHTYDGTGKSPCVFNVSTLVTKPITNDAHPTSARIVGMFISTDNDIPWPVTSLQMWKDFCSFPMKIDILGLVQSQPPILAQHIPQPLCRITNELLMMRRKVRHLQSSLWYQGSTHKLALSVDKELDFTKSSTEAIQRFSTESPTFAHLVFIFNSTGRGCFIRVEHYKISNTLKASCSSSAPTSCHIFACEDELRLQLVTTGLWLKRGLRWNHQKSRSLNKNDENEGDQGRGHPSVRILISAWTPAACCLYIFCRRKIWKRRGTENDEEVISGGNDVLPPPLENGNCTAEIIVMKDLPPTYSEVLEMDTLPPPKYADVITGSSEVTTFLGFHRKQQKPLATNV